jgi:type III restriction enzyme
LRFVLKDFQADATREVVNAVGDGFAKFERSGRLSALSLSAPTGAGKTVIATAVIEQLWNGDEGADPNPELTFLWVTDDPNLNQQTKRKILDASSRIKTSQIVSVDQTFDQEAFDPGKVYFVHIQQLGKGALNYQRTGDKRRTSLWDTIRNTVRKASSRFLLVVDEAHRGTGARKDGEQTITARLIDGGGGAFPAVPVVLGISATPERFIQAISKAGQRTLEPITVDNELVRQSGLIKDKIRIRHPKVAQPADSTLLSMAVDDLRTYDQLWAQYHREQGESLVRPVLVIQVRAKVPDSELEATLDALADAWDGLDGRAVAHSFQEHSTLNLGDRSIRYVAPQDIQDDETLRAVLFKEALTTGWDCPRAEVMVSLRPAQDYTYIAQLIGRMVRTPLARRIATDEVLNTVALYLPYFDESQVSEVVKGIQADEGQIASQIEIDSVICGRNSKVPQDVWTRLGSLPTYTRPGKAFRSDVARLNALAVLLVGNGLDENAVETARRHLVATLDREAARLGKVLDARAEELATLDYQTRTVDLRTGGVETESDRVALNVQNLDDMFRRARRLLGDSAAKWYWDELCDRGMEPGSAKARISAMASDPTVPKSVEIAAGGLVDAWRSDHNAEINELADSKRAAFYRIWQQARSPQEVTMIMPTQITVPDSIFRFRSHIYQGEEKLYPGRFSGWEEAVIKLELGKESLVAWYRNPPGGTAALGVPWTDSGGKRTMYPDFLFLHLVRGELVVDLVDPHRPDEADTAPKWAGLAKYASDHGRLFRRVVAVIKGEDGKLQSLDLKNPDVKARLDRGLDEGGVRDLFSTFGGPY